MKPESAVTTDHSPVYLRVFYILALASLIVYILTVGATLLIPVTVGAFLAMLLAPVARWLEKRRLGRFAGALVPVIGLLAVVGVFASLAVRQISNIGSSLGGSADRVNGIVERVNYFLSWHLNLDKPVLGDLDSEGVVDLVKDSSGKLISMMGGFTESLFGIIIVPALTFFILYYRSHLFKFSVRFLKSATRGDVEKRVEEARLVAQNYFVGMIKVVAILAVLNSGALLLIGVENAIFFGLFAAILNIVPFFGPLVGAILPILFVFVTRDSLYYPLFVGVSFILIQLIEGNILTPRIIGGNVRINPLVVFIGLLAGSMIWGVVGMIIVIPVISISMQLFRLDPRTEPFAYLLGTPQRKAAVPSG
jgi:predicted PurR-regulated permease PerM